MYSKKGFYLLVFVLLHLCSKAQVTAIGGTVNIYTPVLAIDTNLCPSTVTVASSTGFSIGDKVLIIQMKGCDFDSSNAASFGTITNANGAGNYEIAQITGISGNVISLNGRITRVFNISGKVQMVRIPSYTNAQVTSLLTCNAWNGSTGGVLIIDVSGNLSLGANINVVGKGFRGGTISNNPDGGCGSGSPAFFYPLTQAGTSWSSGGAEKGEGIGEISASKRAGRGALVTGGGGGNKHNTGGGGGGNFTAGGQGGNELSGCTISATGGRGGVNASSLFASNRLFLGGGGGSGDQNNGVGSGGAAGGGIVIIMAGSISGNAFMITADGATVTIVGGGAADGVGGGGAGGSIFINTALIGSTFSTSANGGGGGNQAPSGYCVGTGGGGGTGQILSNLPSFTSIITSLLPGNAGLMNTGPATCVNTNYGATAGQTNTVGALASRTLYFTQGAATNVSLNIVSSTPSLCSGNSVTLTASGAASYTWLPMAVSGPTLGFSPASSANLTVVASSAAGCTTGIAYTQSVFPTPTLAVSIASAQICPNTAASFTASGASSYTWLPTAITGSIYSPIVSTNTSYTLLGTIGNCSATTAFTQSVYIQPTVAISPASLAVCSGSVFTLNASGAQTYTWQPGASVGSSYTNAITASSSFTCVGTSINGCTASATRSVSVKPKPTLNFSTFSITCASLGSATVSAVGGVGPDTYNWAPTAQNGSVATNLFPGVYTLTVFDNGTSCTSISSTTFLPLVPLAGTVVASNSVLCNGYNNGTASVVLAAGSGSQAYSWQGATSTQTTATVNNLGAGAYTLVVQDALTFCSITKTFVVTQPPALTLTAIPATASVCLGGSVSFSVSAAGGVPAFSYSWQTVSTQTSIIVTQPTAGNYVYTVQVLDGNACKQTTSVVANFVPNPTVSASSATLCPAQPGTLIANGASTYTWSSGYTGAQYPIAITNNTAFTVIGSALGCTASTTSSVTILPAPTASITSNAPLCAGDTLVLSSSAAQSYVWSGPLSYSSTAASNTIINSTFLQSGIYHVTITAVNGCTATTNKSIVIVALPIPQVAAPPVCEGKTLQLTASYVPASSYTWTGPAGQNIAQNFVIANASPTMSGIYTVQTQNSFGCKASATVQASVQNSLTLSFVGNTISCQGQALQLLAMGASNYFWYGPNSFYSTAPQLSLAVMQPSTMGNYTLVASSGVCTVTAIKQLSVYPQPAFTSSITSPICENKPLMMAATGTGTFTFGGPNNLQWFGSSAIFNATMGAAGVYTCFLQDARLCTASQTLLLVVKPAPKLAVANVTTCVGAQAVLSSTGAVTYTWTTPAGNSFSTASIFVPNVTATTVGNYSVSTTGTNGCTTSSVVLLSVNSITMPAITFSVPPYLCAGNYNTLLASGAEFYNWYGPNNFSSSSASTAVYASNAQSAGIYTLTISNKEKCLASYTLQLNVIQPQQAKIASDKNNVCAPACVQFSLRPAMKSAVFAAGSTTVQNSTICFNEGKTTTITASYIDTAGCSNTASVSLSIYEKPRADFLMSAVEGNVASDVFYFYNHSSGNNINKYLWVVGTSPADSMYSENIDYRFATTGIFPIVLIATNNGSCSDTAIKYVRVLEPFALYLPNAFSPNGDGKNDEFFAKGESLEAFELSIYNRWGQKLFTAQNITDAWDGSYKGQLCKEDIYNWVLTYKSFGKSSQTKTGTVTLLR